MEKTFRIILFLTFVLIVFLHPNLIFAISAPNLLSPSDGSTVSSRPTLTWEAVTDAIQYKVIVDDESSITSPYIKGPYYTTNTKYSPQLNNGTFYWKVAAKDAVGTWSDWSSIWAFTLSTSTPSTTPTGSEDSYSTPYSTPTTSGSDPTPTPSSSKSSFIISDVPSSIDSDKSFTVSVELKLPNSPSTTFYLKGAFRKADSSNYFGYIKVGSSWIKNSNSYTSQYKITTDSSGDWSGTLEIKPNPDDSGFTGTGPYIFKVGRYTSSGSGPTWSNGQTIIINEVAQGDIVSDETQDSKASADLPSGSIIQNPSKNNQNIYNSNLKNPKVAGISVEATPSSRFSEPDPAEKELKRNDTFNFLPIVGGVVLILSGLGSLVYIYRKQKLQSNL